MTLEQQQQLAEALEQNLVLSKQTDHTILDLSDYVDSLEQQLSAALAVCKLKDDALDKIRGHIGLYNLFSCVGSDSYDPECADLNVGKCREIAIEALAIRPGTEALDKWLGEPVAIIGKHGHPKHISAIPSIEENRLYGPFEPLYAKPKGIS